MKLMLSPTLCKNRAYISLKDFKAESFTDSSSDSEGPIQTENRAEVVCRRCLKDFCRESKYPIPDGLLYRFACFHSFDVEKAKTAIKKDADRNYRYLQLRMRGPLREQFKTRTLFPLPGLTTKTGKCEVFYMRPSRYFPGSTTTESIIDNLCYVLNDLSHTKEQCQNGVAFIANMKGWKMENFSVDYCHQFMQALQGHMVPTRVDLFLIVNPPSWFGKIWKIMRPMLSNQFSKKVHIIKEDKFSDFLAADYEQFLPDEFACGWRKTDELVEDYIDKKMYVDAM
eukprot:scaffold2737_cov99-Cylindrotheca_fusiformis.AAC.4